MGQIIITYLYTRKALGYVAILMDQLTRFQARKPRAQIHEVHTELGSDFDELRSRDGNKAKLNAQHKISKILYRN